MVGIPWARRGPALLWGSTVPSTWLKTTSNQYIIYIYQTRNVDPPKSPVPLSRGSGREPPGQLTKREERACPSPSLPTRPTPQKGLTECFA